MKKRMAALLLAMVLSVGTLSVTASAAEAPQIDSNYTIQRISRQEISTYKDEIEIYFARNKNDGKLYMRRWNATRGYWVDPDWILVK